jgi:hypothetical protein
MPIPMVKNNEDEATFVSRCIESIIDEYGQEKASAICYAQYENDTQGGVVGMSEEEFSRRKFEYPPLHKESMSQYMSRCMSDSTVRERKPHRPTRAGFCYCEYQNKYINNIAKGWK